MKIKVIALCLAALMLATACKKKHDEIDFSGTTIGVLECTGQNMSINEIDFGYLVELETPANFGNDYIDASQVKHTNVVILYGTRSVLKDHTHLSGRLYEDNEYSASYCSIRYRSLGIKETVCSKLD